MMQAVKHNIGDKIASTIFPQLFVASSADVTLCEACLTIVEKAVMFHVGENRKWISLCKGCLEKAIKAI